MRRKRKWVRPKTFAAWLAARARAPGAGADLRALVDALSPALTAILDQQLDVYLRERGMKLLLRSRERLVRESPKQRHRRLMQGRLERNRAPDGRAGDENAPSAISEAPGGVLGVVEAPQAGEKILTPFDPPA